MNISSPESAQDESSVDKGVDLNDIAFGLYSVGEVVRVVAEPSFHHCISRS
jgi:hypothetical protein